LIEELEGFLEIEVLDEECGSDLIQHFVQAQLSQVNRVETLANPVDVDLANGFGVSHPPEDAVVLDGER
jgi:hypothetical protein